MPLIVHDREAHGDVYDLLRKYKPNALVHCFSGSVELMREAVRMGMYISSAVLLHSKMPSQP